MRSQKTGFKKQEKINQKQYLQLNKFIKQNKIKFPIPNNQIQQLYSYLLIFFNISKDNQIKKYLIRINHNGVAHDFQTFVLYNISLIDDQINNLKDISQLYEINSLIEKNLDKNIFPENFKIQIKEDVRNLYLNNKSKIFSSNKKSFNETLAILNYLFDYQKYYQISEQNLFLKALYEAIQHYTKQKSFNNKYDEYNQKLKPKQIKLDIQYNLDCQQIIKVQPQKVSKQYFQNGLSEYFFKFIVNKIQNKIKKQDYKQNLQIMHQIITEKEKESVIGSLLQLSQRYKTKNRKIQQFFEKITEQILCSLKDNNQQKNQNQNQKSLPAIFYFINSLYLRHQIEYHSGIRKAILQLCKLIKHKLQGQIYYKKQKGQFCLIHAFKLIQTKHIPRHQIAEQLSKQKPEKIQHQTLKNSLRFILDEQFQNSKKTNNNISKLLYSFHIDKYDRDITMPKIQLLRLTSTKRKRNIIIMISGFLSEDTDKFQEWKGLLEQIYDSEIYALKWQSQSVKNFIKSLFDINKNFIPNIIKGNISLALTILQTFINISKQNVFNQAYKSSKITGIYLADLLAQIFQDHFITLVGFSLGTQVILSALKQFQKIGKLHMINRVVTMGGVANHKQIQQFLYSINQNQKKTISLNWKNVYCKTDYILKYAFRLYSLYSQPIGLNKIHKDQQLMKKNNKKQQYKAFYIQNLDVTDIISGHLDYRDNLNKIGKFLELMHQ